MITKKDVARELLRRRAARSSLIGYAKFIDVPGAPVGDDDTETFLPAETELAQHHELILSATQRCIERHSGRTMLFLPPGSAKSTYATVVSPTWVMGARPGFKTIAVSYGTDLARKFGRRMRSIVRQPAFQKLFDTTLSADSSAAHEWALSNGSEFMGGGILSGVTGNRADFIAIDDPIKGRQDADSETVRKSTKNAYDEDILTRLKPGGSLMITQTRWHQDDLVGSILPEKWAGESGMIKCRDGNNWEVICVPAKCDRTDDPLGRSIGDYIWPEWFTDDHWAPFEKMQRTWSALYQQRPVPYGGGMFKRSDFRVIQAEPAGYRWVRGWDLAATEDPSAARTAGVKMGICPDNRLCIAHVVKDQVNAAGVERLLGSTAAADGQDVRGSIPQDPGSAGKSWALHLLKSSLMGYSYTASPETGDKETRAMPLAAQVEAGNVDIVAGDWNSDFLDEASTFPMGKFKDQIDAATRAFDLLVAPRASAGIFLRKKNR